jgi:hypothetical protein
MLPNAFFAKINTLPALWKKVKKKHLPAKKVGQKFLPLYSNCQKNWPK